MSTKAGVVVLEKIKNHLLPTGKRTPFLGLSFFCVVTTLTELSRLSSLPQAKRVINHSKCPPSPHPSESPLSV